MVVGIAGQTLSQRWEQVAMAGVLLDCFLLIRHLLVIGARWRDLGACKVLSVSYRHHMLRRDAV